MATVLVTGANRGLGLEFVRQYAEAGERVYAGCRHPERATELAKIAAAHPERVQVHALDVTGAASVESFARALKDEPIDLLINNAGLLGSRAAMPDYALWEESFRVNTIAPFRVSQAFRENLLKGSMRKLVTITSQMGSTTNNHGGYYHYRSSKAAVNNVMRGLSQDWSQDGFIVVVVHPGWVQTDMGGSGAALTPKESIAAMRKLFDKLRPSDNGKFFDYRGGELPW